jgi:hypothetical protein
MLYTVVPLERIYAIPRSNDRNNKDKLKETSEPEYRDVLLPHGRIMARREGENYIIERVNSTDMSDYLKDDYVPGKNIKY